MAAKDERPFEPTFRERSDWFRCAICGRTFGGAEGLRSHRRFNRCTGARLPPDTDLDGSSLPGDLGLELDPLDDPKLTGDELRRAVTRRLRHLAGLPEAP